MTCCWMEKCGCILFKGILTGFIIMQAEEVDFEEDEEDDEFDRWRNFEFLLSPLVSSSSHCAAAPRAAASGAAAAAAECREKCQ